ncbi:unnamed protein product, partial [Closterium sp. Naga37s-1]
HYFLFDFPGQVELFTLHSSAQSIIKRLTDKMHYRLAAVHLVDAQLCSEAHCSSMSIPILPHTCHCSPLSSLHAHQLAAVHLVDAHLCSEAHKYVAALLLSLQVKAFNLDFYTDVQDHSYLQPSIKSFPSLPLPLFPALSIQPRLLHGRAGPLVPAGASRERSSQQAILVSAHSIRHAHCSTLIPFRCPVLSGQLI